MVVESPSARERRLARELRGLRASIPLHGKDVAERLGWSPSKVSRIETARIGISSDDLDRLLALYAVPDAHATFLRRLAPSARHKGWWDAYADTLSAGYANLIRLEAGSRALRCYGALVPHALLQSPDFVRQVILSTWETPSPVEVDRRVQVCRRRQDVLDAGEPDGPLQLHAVLDESVLRRTAVAPGRDGGAAIMRGQLEWLADAAGRPNVTFQVLPFAAGLPPVTAGSFSVLESRATGAPDVVYLENKTRVFYLDSEAEVHRYGRAFELLSSMALDPEQSLDLVRRTGAAL
ncbi:XRE family transcriptional regulator [Blastococcus sp. CT_GayMR20]|uniref:helix-turn-helix domain-containing protein n=1 Tax=Blastococcus sp. CT_GayMR20 TaxID=2559609 RepID=UPI001073AC85|nr:helix-turn-helix transcriptional regulator [Blastococcus sp. CT_GayMR20]TFV71652.1 XRE family transcriptional regulator [Blastococcus sp. CT_GayMR20]